MNKLVINIKKKYFNEILNGTKKEEFRKDWKSGKAMTKGIKKSGTFMGKSNKLGHGGRAAQLKAKGVPGGVIGMLARKAQAAPGQKNYHGGKK